MIELACPREHEQLPRASHCPVARCREGLTIHGTDRLKRQLQFGIEAGTPPHRKNGGYVMSHGRTNKELHRRRDGSVFCFHICGVSRRLLRRTASTLNECANANQLAPALRLLHAKFNVSLPAHPCVRCSIRRSARRLGRLRTRCNTPAQERTSTSGSCMANSLRSGRGLSTR